MNKPPERLRIVIVNGIPVVSALCAVLEGRSEHFYTLEKEPMENKTENLTTEEAWAAMARGECVQTAREIFHLYNGGVLKYWDGHFWVNTSTLGGGPYSIVPDPSKPKEVGEVDELVIEFAEFVDEKVGGKYEPEQDLNQADLTRLMLDFINSKFARKP